jgi:hypothetical protein
MTLAFAASLTAQPRGDGTYYSIYGLQFLNGLQSLRVAVQSPRYSDSEIIPCIRVSVVVDFYESAGDGSVRPRATRRVTRQVELDPGDAASFDLPAALACDGSVCPQLRNGIYASVSVFARPVEGEPLPSGRLKFNSTLVLRENGRTIFTLPAAEKGFDPQPDPPQE